MCMWIFGSMYKEDLKERQPSFESRPQDKIAGQKLESAVSSYLTAGEPWENSLSFHLLFGFQDFPCIFIAEDPSVCSN